jgi:hypothetical protein
MFIRRSVLAVSLLAFGCTEQPSDTNGAGDTQEIIANLIRAGFPAGDLQVVDGVVVTGRDAEVSLAASREMLRTGESGKEQYRTTNLISSSLAKICVNGSTFTGVFSTALDLAIQNYDELPLTFAMARTPSAGCSFTINAVIAPGVVGGSSGFPAGGVPFSTINIGDGLSTFSVDTIEHVITHEIGHTIGFRHADFFNRTISCGTGGNEGDAGVGAILIPGTPSDATVGGSIMNSCFRTVETGEFTASDLTALNALYGAVLDYNIAFQANTTDLWIVGPGGPGDAGLGMMVGTSPSIARLTSGGYEAAFQANTGNLWVTGTAGTADTGLGMRAGTSPSITALAGGGYQVAFQANTTELWTTGTAGTTNTGLGMLPGTSPSITGLGGNGFQAAFQANTTELWTTGTAGTTNTGLGMLPGTSPSIARLVTGGFQVAFQANTTELWTTGTAGTTNTGLGMATATSPSITGLAGGGFQVAFQANTTDLWFTGTAGTADTGLGMAGHTSPSIAARPGSGFDLVFQANTGNLWTAGTTGTRDLGLGMGANTSPSTD